MNSDASVVSWPDYQQFYRWVDSEVDGLSEAQLDFDAQVPMWMQWSIRRQVSHVAWIILRVMHRRFHTFLWPDGRIPAPIRWEDHRLSTMKSDRRLDESAHWAMDDLLDKLKLGIDWATQVVATVPVETLRHTESTFTLTDFWRSVIPVIPRGAWLDAERPNQVHFTLEASLWMIYWEPLVHLYTIQRLKRVQGLTVRSVLPRVGYLTIPEYIGASGHSAPEMTPIR